MPDQDLLQGRLKKLTRSPASRTFDTWQARDCEVDRASGTFAYASSDKPRKALTLASAKVRPMEPYKGKPFVFVVDFKKIVSKASLSLEQLWVAVLREGNTN